MSDAELTNYWDNKARDFLIGKRIKYARYQTLDEAQDMGWHDRGLVVWLEDGSNFIVQRDDEGNGAGALNIADATGNENILPTLRSVGTRGL